MFTFRTPSLDDVDWITEACQDPEILRWTLVPRPYTTDHARGFVADHAGEIIAWAIFEDGDSRGVGMLGVHHIVDGVASIGYWIAPWARRRGAATAAIAFVCRELATWDDLHSVSATIAATNIASRRTAERAGLSAINSPSADHCPDGDKAVEGVKYLLNLDRSH